MGSLSPVSSIAIRDLSQDNTLLATTTILITIQKRHRPSSSSKPFAVDIEALRAHSGCAQLHYRLSRLKRHVENGRSIYLSGSPWLMLRQLKDSPTLYVFAITINMFIIVSISNFVSKEKTYIMEIMASSGTNMMRNACQQVQV
ncbi:hypothetical protein OIU76_030543 [Salix suchowensis]|nr:hypothetical protein OIU76_030543 [Salix suchowensis]